MQEAIRSMEELQKIMAAKMQLVKTGNPTTDLTTTLALLQETQAAYLDAMRPLNRLTKETNPELAPLKASTRSLFDEAGRLLDRYAGVQQEQQQRETDRMRRKAEETEHQRQTEEAEHRLQAKDVGIATTRKLY